MTAREMQRRSAKARWSGLSAAERKAKMSALAKARWAKTVCKPKRVTRRSNAELSRAPTRVAERNDEEKK